MLFTDGNFVTAQDLLVLDSDFATVAQAENILTDNSQQSIVTRALSELGNDFTAKFQNFTGYLVGVGAGANHNSAVLNILSTAINRPRALLSQIVVTEPDPTRLSFRRWAEYYCLWFFYRGVFHRRMNDKYEPRMLMWAEEAKRSLRILQANGYPIVIAPLSCPGATLLYGAGTWGLPNVSLVTAGALAAATDFDVSITYVSIPGYVSGAFQNGSESAGAARVTVTCALNQTVSVSLAGLNPPNGTLPNAIGTAAGIYPAVKATHWNVYVGLKGGPLYLQNGAPIPIATTSYALAGAPALSGFIQNAGQPAMYDMSHNNVIARA